MGAGVTAATPRPMLRYPGGKTRLAPWIVSHLPPHQSYVEPFAGSAAVLFAKPRSKVEVINDLDDRVCTLFRVIRERPDELARAVALTPYARAEYLASYEPADDELEVARRFLVRVWMAHGGKLGSKSGWRAGWAGGDDSSRGSSANVWCGLPERIAEAAARLRGVMVDNRPALRVLQDWHYPGALVYADPPYVRSALPMTQDTAKNRRNERPRYYAHEMTDEEHHALLDALEAHPGPVLLSGYRCPLYDDRLAGWVRVDRATYAYRQAERTESLWLNPMAVELNRLPLFAEVAP
jgi:DNA adenine methylase